jgi:hypothetical protein
MDERCKKCGSKQLYMDGGEVVCLDCSYRDDPEKLIRQAIAKLYHYVRMRALHDLVCPQGEKEKRRCFYRDYNIYPSCRECQETAREYVSDK